MKQSFIKPLALALGAAALTLAGTALADTADEKGMPSAQEPCQAQPAQPQENGGKNTGQSGTGADSLSETLAPCGGVLAPPPTGDGEMSTPAPDEGRTPVIKPGEVPAQ